MTVETGIVDEGGRLVSADARLLALQQGAGGRLGGALAVPQLATLARLARNLATPVARTVIAAEGLSTVELTVNAKPEAGQVRLSIAGWTPAPLPIADPTARAFDYARLEADLAWSTDAELRITRLAPGFSAALDHRLMSGGVGQPLSAIFRLLPNREGALPILAALAQNKPFSGQLAELGGQGAVRVTLSGQATIGTDGAFRGIEGTATLANALPDGPAISATDRPLSQGEAMTQRLDSALRAPIGRIIDSADAIAQRQEGAIRQDYAGYADDIATAGRHLLGLVDGLADLQAVERPDFAIPAETIDLADIARRAAGLLRVRAADGRVRIDAPQEEESLSARGDFGRVLQIMVNLLGNAVRYSPEGAMVWIRTEEEGDLAAVIVADLGKGIAEADLERIFEKFERVDPNEPGGSGLGLYISRRLARAMGGDITVDSAPGQGARFVLTLPRS